MNYLRNRYPFKLFTNIFRIATSSNSLPKAIDLKRTKSDSALAEATRKSISKDSINPGKKRLPKSASEYKNINKSSVHSLKTVDSNNSLPHSKTSSEHSFRDSLDRKPPSLDLGKLNLKKPKSSLDRELKYKLKKLQSSLGSSSSREILSEEERPRLKRPYPWQNFNLNNVQQKQSDEDLKKGTPGKTLAVRPSLSDQSLVSVSNTSLTSKSSSQSLRSFNSASSMSLDSNPSKDRVQELKEDMPYFKSILKKSIYKRKPTKEVTFNSISTIYGPSTSYSHVVQQTRNLDGNRSSCVKNQSMKKTIDVLATDKTKNNDESLKKLNKELYSVRDSDRSFGKYEPLKEEHSFLYLYNEKRQKTLK